MASVIHPTAIVASDAVIGADVEIGAYSVVQGGVEIGARTVVGPHVVIAGPTTIGEDNQIHQFASIGDAPQDKKYKGEPTRLEIGHRNVFREYCTVNRGTVTGHAVTKIGDDNMLLAYTHVGHDCTLGNKIVLSNLVMLGGHVEIGDWVIMSGYAGAHQFSKIGAHAFIGNNTAVTRDVPPYVLATGQPAEPRSINSEGLKRRGFSAEQIRNIRNAFRVLYRSGLKLAEAEEQLKVMAQEFPEIQPLVDFLPQSTRSIVR
ncbi:MAG TPA: acyl-ACP--UDP-N-acetylglucosamine O-acyltransferase [Steroidobacteraceae bacterium]